MRDLAIPPSVKLHCMGLYRPFFFQESAGTRLTYVPLYPKKYYHARWMTVTDKAWEKKEESKHKKKLSPERNLCSGLSPSNSCEIDEPQIKVKILDIGNR